jgi:hypothetical protein
MAIKKTTKLQRVEVSINGDDINLNAYHQITLDDASDDELPVSTGSSKFYQKMTTVTAADGSTSIVATDMSGADALVQKIATAVWAD